VAALMQPGFSPCPTPTLTDAQKRLVGGHDSTPSGQLGVAAITKIKWPKLCWDTVRVSIVVTDKNGMKEYKILTYKVPYWC